MALTLPALGKALEDVIKALKKNTTEIGTIKGAYDRQIKTLERTVKIQQAAFTLSDFLPKDVTVDTASTEQKETAQKALDELVQKQESYHNVIRNKNSSISVPEAHDTTDAVNKKYVDDRLAAHQIILESRMPLNPVCAYDMADVHTQKQNIYTLPAPIMVKDNPTIIDGINIYTANSEGSYYHIHSEMSFTGNAKPAVIVYQDDWKTMPLWEYCNGTQDFYVFIEKQNFNFLIGVWMQGAAGYQVQSDDSVSVNKFTVTKLTDRVLIDSSGNGNHATVSGGVIQKSDDMVGTSLACTKGFIKRKPLDCIGLGKSWSHSRWVKVDEHKAGEWEYLFSYGYFDWCSLKDGVIATQSKKNASCELNIDVNLLMGSWTHVVVQTKLTATSCTKELYLKGKLVARKEVNGDFSDIENQDHTDMNYGTGYVKGSFASLLFFDRFLTESEILWLSRNQYYPAKRYSLAEYKTDENRKLLEQLKKEAFCFRGDIAEADLDKTVTPGSYKVNKSDFSTTLLVFESRGSIGVVQFYKEDYNESTPWKYRHALDGDTSRWTAWQTFVPTSAFSLSDSTLSIKM